MLSHVIIKIINICARNSSIHAAIELVLLYIASTCNNKERNAVHIGAQYRRICL